jgi:hypothetical protein
MSNATIEKLQSGFIKVEAAMLDNESGSYKITIESD